MNPFFSNTSQPRFLPMSRAEMGLLGWDSLDILLVSGDAYIDQPSSGVPLLGRWLVHHGFKVGIIAQPDWRTPDAMTVMGRPRLFAGVSAGAIDSLLAHYTAFRKKRHDDAYTPGGRAGARPNRACIIYTNLIRQAFPGLPVVLGGIEASLRRITHYDFWTDSLRRSILLDAKATTLVYGMGERALLALAQQAAAGEELRTAGTVRAVSAATVEAAIPSGAACVHLPSHEDLLRDKTLLMRATLDSEMLVHRGDAYAVQVAGDRALIIEPPAAPLTTAEMDELYSLPYSRRAHPSYREAIPADAMMRTSITSHRGCGGGCSFCSLALHQGRRISSRSAESIMEEARILSSARPVAISDIGGPTANMWQAHCSSPAPCRRRSCCFPAICRYFVTPQDRHVSLLRRVARLPDIKQVRVASGVRADIALRDMDALSAYTMEFTGGQLKVAPEHCADAVLRQMRKPPLHVFETFLRHFLEDSRNAGREQYVVPYLMSAFPGCTETDMRELAAWLRQRHWAPRQVQCFIPTPGTVATAMYYGGISEQGAPVYVARSDAERLKLHSILMPALGRKPSTRAQSCAPGPGSRPGTPKEDIHEHDGRTPRPAGRTLLLSGDRPQRTERRPRRPATTGLQPSEKPRSGRRKNQRPSGTTR